MAKFNILNKAEKVVDYVMIITDKSPKRLRTDVIPELRRTALNIMRNIISANHYKVAAGTSAEELKLRRKFQEQAMVEIEILDGIAEICVKRNYITNKQFDYLTLLTYELKDMIFNWIRSDDKRK